jgi:hypothetical protein
VRCPACGASNGDRAEWCTQCYRPLRSTSGAEASGAAASGATGSGATGSGAAGSSASAADASAADASAATHPPGGAAGAGPPPPAPGAGQRDVRTVDGQVEWRCVGCDGWNALDAPVCATCASPRRGFGDPALPPPVDPADRTRLVVASVVLPGLGHLLARRTGTGAARVVTALAWLAGAFLLVRGGGGSVVVAPLLLGVAVVWAGSLHDVLALVDGGRELLTTRVLLWLTGAVVLSLVALMVAGVGTPGGG